MYEINRSVFLLMPLEPFWRWLQSLPDVDLSDIELEDLQADANAYLVNPCDSADEVWEEIEARFEDIFAAELADWCEDERQWPAPRYFQRMVRHPALHHHHRFIGRAFRARSLSSHHLKLNRFQTAYL